MSTDAPGPWAAATPVLSHCCGLLTWGCAIPERLHPGPSHTRTSGRICSSHKSTVLQLKKKKVLCLPLCSLYSHSKKGGGEECLISNRDPSDNLNIATDLGFPEAPVAENVPANAGDVRDACSIPGWGRGGHGNPLQYFCLENPHGQRSLAGNSPWGHKESTTTEETWHAHTDNI